ncbi:hypothetical protein ACLOJK_027531 [Asimina triloba]
MLGVNAGFAWIDALRRLSVDLVRWVIDADSVFLPAAELVLDLDQDAFDSVLLMDGLMLANPMLGSAQIDQGVPSDGMDADLQARALLLVTGSRASYCCTPLQMEWGCWLWAAMEAP